MLVEGALAAAADTHMGDTVAAEGQALVAAPYVAWCSRPLSDAAPEIGG